MLLWISQKKLVSIAAKERSRFNFVARLAIVKCDPHYSSQNWQLSNVWCRPQYVHSCVLLNSKYRQIYGAYETIHSFLSTLFPSSAAWTRSQCILLRLRTPSPGDIQTSTPSPPPDVAVGGWLLPAGRGSADHWSWPLTNQIYNQFLIASGVSTCSDQRLAFSSAVISLVRIRLLAVSELETDRFVQWYFSIHRILNQFWTSQWTTSQWF